MRVWWLSVASMWSITMRRSRVQLVLIDRYVFINNLWWKKNRNFYKIYKIIWMVLVINGRLAPEIRRHPRKNKFYRGLSYTTSYVPIIRLKNDQSIVKNKSYYFESHRYSIISESGFLYLINYILRWNKIQYNSRPNNNHNNSHYEYLIVNRFNTSMRFEGHEIKIYTQNFFYVWFYCFLKKIVVYKKKVT